MKLLGYAMSREPRNKFGSAFRTHREASWNERLWLQLEKGRTDCIPFIQEGVGEL